MNILRNCGLFTFHAYGLCTTVRMYLQQWIQDFRELGTKPKRGAPTYYLANFPRKLHENEENWTVRARRVSIFSK